MNRKKILLFFAVGTLLFTGCSFVNEPAAEQASGTTEENAATMEASSELSARESSQYRSDLPLAQKLQLAEEIVMKMPQNGMKQMSALFPDLVKSHDVGDKDPENIMMMGPEVWYYSKEADITVAVCVATDSPFHIFKGRQPSMEEIKDAQAMIHDTMPAMDSSMERSGNAVYEDYSEARYSALKGKESFVLFFHANWCPICRRMEKDITSQLNSFPSGTVILKTDFDTETELKKEYDILVQSTVVVLDKNGKIIYKGQDPSIDELKSQIEKSLTS